MNVTLKAASDQPDNSFSFETYQWTIDKLETDQTEVVLQIMMKIKQWVEWDGVSPFAPLRMTVHGKPGTGKSVVIKTLQSLCFKIFGTHDCVKVCAPTGGAAFNAGGETCHRQWGVTRSPKTLEISSERKKYLMKNCMKILLLIIDESSLLDAYTLGSMENSARQCVHSSSSQGEKWGNIPVIVIFGDYFQLPSISPGVFEMMDVTKKKQVLSSIKNPLIADLTASGWEQYVALAEVVLSLSIPKRVDKSNKELLAILDALRGEDDETQLNNAQIDRLLGLCLNNNQKFTSDQQALIKSQSTCLFATREARNLHNSEMLLKLNRLHPVCICPSVTVREGRVLSLNSHYDSERTPSRTLLIKGAKVQLTGWNAKPDWGLFHSSIGEIVDIVFRDGESPNSGDFPSYVLVDFPQYRGPSFDVTHPTYVPIVPHVTRCKYGCGCTRTYVPLTLAFGKTIHSFQGFNVGPVTDGQPQNAIKSVVVDPGTRNFEAMSPGLLYSVTSRVSTLGHILDLTTSALFFDSINMNFRRIYDITRKKDGTPYFKVSLRSKWVEYLKQRELKTKKLSSAEQHQVTQWILKHDFPISVDSFSIQLSKWCRI